MNKREPFFTYGSIQPTQKYGHLNVLIWNILETNSLFHQFWKIFYTIGPILDPKHGNNLAVSLIKIRIFRGPNSHSGEIDPVPLFGRYAFSWFLPICNCLYTLLLEVSKSAFNAEEDYWGKMFSCRNYVSYIWKAALWTVSFW